MTAARPADQQGHLHASLTLLNVQILQRRTRRPQFVGRAFDRLGDAFKAPPLVDLDQLDVTIGTTLEANLKTLAE